MKLNFDKHGAQQRRVLFGIAILLFACSFLHYSFLNADDNQGLQKQASWSIPAPKQITEELLSLAKTEKLSEAQTAQIKKMWLDETGADQVALLRKYVETVIQIYPESRELCQRVLSEEISQQQLQAELLSDEGYPLSVRENLRLAFARSMVKNALYDEAIIHLEAIKQDSVIDPASLLFFRAICYRNLLKKEEAIETVNLLLENENIPTRYREIANLIAMDLKPLKADSLDEISRMMDDIQRRQRLYRSGTKVRKAEDEVVAKLDKMIEELEKQAQKQQQSAAGNPGGGPTKPAEDSNADGGVSGAGNVDRKQQIDGGNWGDLPPKDRAASMAELVKDLPPHYRQVIEAYFKKIAGDEPQR